MTAAILLLTLGLAAANGGNDVPKGVATLAGAGVTRYRTAILWGTAATLAGSLTSLYFAAKLTKLFSKGIVTAAPTPAFALAVLCGAAAWVVLATVARLPVSTTHAIVGALVGAGLVLAPGAVAWAALTPRVVLPLLVAIGLSYAISVLLASLPRRIPECLCIDVTPATEFGVAGACGPGGAGSAAFAPAPPPRPIPSLRLAMGTVEDCKVHAAGTRRIGLNLNGAHWVSSGAASFARGLNDTPKIVAVGAFALVPAGMTTTQVLVLVAGAMVAGSLVAGIGIARRLGEDVVVLDHVEGFKANFTTAILVGLAANRGLPLSTTHVSTGAITGAAGTSLCRLNGRTLGDFALAWTVTPLVAAAVAAGVHLTAR